MPRRCSRSRGTRRAPKAYIHTYIHTYFFACRTMAGAVIHVASGGSTSIRALSERDLRRRCSMSIAAAVLNRASRADARARRQPLQQPQRGPEPTHLVLAISEAAHRRAQHRDDHCGHRWASGRRVRQQRLARAPLRSRVSSAHRASDRTIHDCARRARRRCRCSRRERHCSRRPRSRRAHRRAITTSRARAATRSRPTSKSAHRAIASLLCPRLAATTAHAVASTAALATALAA